MKKVKMLLFLLLIISLFPKSSFSWNFEITAPTGTIHCPTIYYYNGGQLYVNISYTISGGGNYYSFVRITQGGSSYNTIEQEGSGNQTVQLSYSNICFNNDAQIDVFVKPQGGSYDHKTVYFRLYSETQSLGCITGLGKSVAVNGESWSCYPDCNWRTSTFYSLYGCFAPPAYYSYIRYKVEWTKTGSFSNSSIVVHNDLCLGYSGQIPNYQTGWGYGEITSSTTAHFYTFVYHLKNSLNQDIGWWPCEPQDAAVVYSVVANPAPIISSIGQDHPLYPGGSCVITCTLSQGNCCGIEYEWVPHYKPAFITFTPSENDVTLNVDSKNER